MNIFINTGLDYKHYHQLSLKEGDLSVSENSLKFNTRNIINYCQKYNIINIFVKETIYNRNQRRALYNTIKQYTKDINCTIFSIVTLQSIPYSLYGDCADEVSLRTTLSNITSFQPPREGVDCDILTVLNTGCYYLGYSFEELINKNLGHSVPSHKETITEHLDMVTKACSNSKISKHTELITIGKYHDQGKYFNKEWSDERNKIHYPDHAGISSYIFLMGLYENVLWKKREQLPIFKSKEIYRLDESNKRILEVIYRHMVRYSPDGISKKFIKKNKLTEREIELLEEISKIDAENRIKENEEMKIDENI